MNFNIRGLMDPKSPEFRFVLIGLAAFFAFVLMMQVFPSLITGAIWYGIIFGILGIALVAFEAWAASWAGRTTGGWILYRRSELSRFIVAVGISVASFLLWDVRSAFFAGLILIVWNVLVLMSAFILGGMLWRNRDHVVQTVKDLKQGKADPAAVASSVLHAAGEGAKGGFAQARHQAEEGLKKARS